MRNYALLEGHDLMGTLSSILREHQVRPLKKFLFFVTKGFDLSIIELIKKNLPDCEFAGGVVYGIGDYSKQYHHNGALLVRLEDNATIEYGSSRECREDGLIFSSTHQEGIRGIVDKARKSNVNLFGSNLINIFYNDLILSSEEVLYVGSKINNTKTSVAWKKTVETPKLYDYELELNSRELAQEFLDCAYEIAEEEKDIFIVTCQERVENILYKDFDYLEQTKEKHFKGTGVEGFGFAAEGVYAGKATGFSHRTSGLGFAALKGASYESIN